MKSAEHKYLGPAVFYSEPPIKDDVVGRIPLEPIRKRSKDDPIEPQLHRFAYVDTRGNVYIKSFNHSKEKPTYYDPDVDDIEEVKKALESGKKPKFTFDL